MHLLVTWNHLPWKLEHSARPSRNRGVIESHHTISTHISGPAVLRCRWWLCTHARGVHNDASDAQFSSWTFKWESRPNAAGAVYRASQGMDLIKGDSFWTLHRANIRDWLYQNMTQKWSSSLHKPRWDWIPAPSPLNDNIFHTGGGNETRLSSTVQPTANNVCICLDENKHKTVSLPLKTRGNPAWSRNRAGLLSGAQDRSESCLSVTNKRRLGEPHTTNGAFRKRSWQQNKLLIIDSSTRARQPNRAETRKQSGALLFCQRRADGGLACQAKRIASRTERLRWHKRVNRSNLRSLVVFLHHGVYRAVRHIGRGRVEGSCNSPWLSIVSASSRLHNKSTPPQRRARFRWRPTPGKPLRGRRALIAEELLGERLSRCQNLQRQSSVLEEQDLSASGVMNAYMRQSRVCKNKCTLKEDDVYDPMCLVPLPKFCQANLTLSWNHVAVLTLCFWIKLRRILVPFCGPRLGELSNLWTNGALDVHYDAEATGWHQITH